VVAIGAQLSKGIRDAHGNILKGADAISYLRSQIQNAGGTAKEFRERLLDTYKGQRILLKGSLQTLAISLGEPLAMALKPLVTMVIDSVNAIIKFIEAMPKPIKNTIGKLILVFGGLLTGGGIIALFMAALPLLVIALKAVAAAAVVAAAVMAVIGAVVGTVALIFRGYNTAADDATDKTNTLTRAWDKLKLGFTALAALISGKPVSKEIVDDLQKAENEGVFKFVQSVGRMIIRVKRFFTGMGAGFDSIFRTAKPVFDALFEAFGELGKVFGMGGDAMDKFSGGPVERFMKAGYKIGRVIAIVVIGIIKTITFVANLVAGVIGGVKAGFEQFRPVIDILVESFRSLFAEVGKFLEELGLVTGGMETTGGFARVLGKAIGFIATVIRLQVVPAIIVWVNMFRGVIAVWRGIVWLFKKGLEFIRGKWDKISKFFQTEIVERFQRWKDKLLEAVQPIIDIFSKLLGIINQVISKIDKMTGVSQKAADAAEGVANFFGFTLGGEPEAKALEFDEGPAPTELKFAEVGGARPQEIARSARRNVMASIAQAEATGGDVKTALQSSIMAGISQQGLTGEDAKAFAAEMVKAWRERPPVLNVDGTVLNDASRQGGDDAANREFRQVPVEG
jgi:hypothetical protein